MTSSEVETLEPAACWALLRCAEVGRLAISLPDGPDIFPVNYVVDHGSVVFRTAPGTKLAGIKVNPVVAFEADGQDPDRALAWSVVLRGSGEQISGAHAVRAADSLPLVTWSDSPKYRYVRLTPHSITGRRFLIVPTGAPE